MTTEQEVVAFGLSLDNPIGIRLPKEHWHRINAIAATEGLKSADIVRRAVREYLETSM